VTYIIRKGNLLLAKSGGRVGERKLRERSETQFTVEDKEQNLVTRPTDFVLSSF
jgi:hypothetical protein